MQVTQLDKTENTLYLATVPGYPTFSVFWPFTLQLAPLLLASQDHLGLLVLLALQDPQDYQVWPFKVQKVATRSSISEWLYHISSNNTHHFCTGNLSVLYSMYWSTPSGPIGPAGLPGQPGRCLHFFCSKRKLFRFVYVALWVSYSAFRLSSQVLKVTEDIRESRESKE